MKIKLLATTIALCALPALASAAPARPGGYMSGFIGVSIPKDADVHSEQLAAGPVINYFEDKLELDPGFRIAGTGGYDFGYIRLEGELSYKEAEINSVRQVTPTAAEYRNIDGDIGTLALLANVFFDLHNDSPVTPYWGAGAGFATVHLSDVDGTRLSDFQRYRLYDSDTTSTFAYQAGVGLEFALSPRMSLDLAYRYFATTNAEFDTNWDSTTEFKLESHNVALGFRAKF